MFITTTSLPNVLVGTTYNQTVSSVGGTPPYTWSVIGGFLPTGLTLDANTGDILGIPTVVGSYTFILEVQEDPFAPIPDPQPSDSATFTIVVYSTAIPTITTISPLVSGTVGLAYTTTFTANLGVPPYISWLQTSGTLPLGLTLNPTTGVLSGTPTTSGTYTFDIRVTDSSSQTFTKSFTLNVNNLAQPDITNTSLDSGTIGAAYTDTMLVAGGTSPLVYTVSVGTLPTGLTIGSSNGIITGTPTVIGSFPFTVLVTDANGQTDSQPYTIDIFGIVPPGPVLLATASPLPNGTQAVPYTFSFSAIPGTPPYTYTIVGGALPSGFTLTSAGLLSGTTTAGVYTFDVQVQDSISGTDTLTYSLTIAGPPPLVYSCCFCVFTDTTVTLSDNSANTGILTANGGTVLTNSSWLSPSQEGTFTLTLTVGSQVVYNLVRVVNKLKLTNPTDTTIYLTPGGTYEIPTNYDSQYVTWEALNCDTPIITSRGRIDIHTSCTDKCFGALSCTVRGTLSSLPTGDCSLDNLSSSFVDVKIVVNPVFPSEDCCGPKPIKVRRRAPEFSVVKQIFEGGCSEEHLRNKTPTIKWDINYKALPSNITEDSICPSCTVTDKCGIHTDGCLPYLKSSGRMDDFWMLVYGEFGAFTYTDPQTGITYQDVKFDGTVEHDHINRFTDQSRTYQLVWRPCCNTELAKKGGRCSTHGQRTKFTVPSGDPSLTLTATTTPDNVLTFNRDVLLFNSEPITIT